MQLALQDPSLHDHSSDEFQARVRFQLDRLLQSIHFRNSRRYPALLRYIVEQTLAGHGPALKERTLGCEVFGRPADYDTAADPIVRVTVAEIRKRIAQYYHEEAHGSELRIELNPGSYIPEFLPAREPETTAAAVPEALLTASEPGGAEPPFHSAAANIKRNSTQSRWLYGASAAILLAAAIFSLRPWLRPAAMDRLWSPFFADAGPVTFCLPISVPKRGGGCRHDG